MKKDLITLLCMTLVCASVMLGVMGIYRIVGSQHRKNTINGISGLEKTAFNVRGLKCDV